MTRAVTFLASLAVLLFPALAVAGANNASLSCVSTAASGETMRLTASIPGDFSEFSVTLTSASSSLTVSDSTGAISVIDDFQNLMFTLTVTGKDQGILILYGLPKTMTHKTGPNRGVDAHFAAMLRRAPISADESVSPVPFSCAYHFSI